MRCSVSVNVYEIPNSVSTFMFYDNARNLFVCMKPNDSMRNEKKKELS